MNSRRSFLSLLAGLPLLPLVGKIPEVKPQGTDPLTWFTPEKWKRMVDAAEKAARGELRGRLFITDEEWAALVVRGERNLGPYIIMRGGS